MHTPAFDAPLGGLRRITAILFGTEKLERYGYPKVKQVRQQDACPANAGGGQLQRCVTPVPGPLFNGHTSVAHCTHLSTLDSTDRE